MLPYWLFFSIFAVAAFLYRPSPSGQAQVSNAPLLVAWLLITLMVGLRFEVGPDWESYLGWWERAGYMTLQRFSRIAQSDPLFHWSMWAMRRGNLPQWFAYSVYAGIFAAGVVSFSRHQTNPWLSIAVAIPYLTLVFAMSGVRQATAIGFVFLAINALKRQDRWKFLLWVALGASCHASAIIVLPLAALSFTRNRLVSTMLIVVTVVVGAYFLSATFSTYSERYIRSVDESAGTLYRIAMTVVPCLLYFLLRDRFSAASHEASFWRNMALTGLLTLPIYFVVSSSTALDRLLLYIFPLQMYVLSRVPDVIGQRGGRYGLTAMIIFYLALQLFVFLSFGVNAIFYVPYQSVITQG